MAANYEGAYAGTAVADESVDVRLSFVKRVYGWMFAALLVCTLGAAISIQSGMVMSLLRMGIGGIIVLTLAWWGTGYLAIKVRHKPTVNIIAYAVYALMTGFVLSGIIYVAMAMGESNTGSSGTYIYQALGLTLVSFGGISAYAYFTKRDFSFMRGMLTVGFVVVLGLVISSLFIDYSTPLQIAISGAVVLLFAGYTLYDTQRIFREYPKSEHLAASIQLFGNVVMMFMYILRMILLLARD